ncbi:MAG: adenylate/guanylate cyclase domain-containing protein, partial [Spirochaetota bacterium]
KDWVATMLSDTVNIEFYATRVVFILGSGTILASLTHIIRKLIYQSVELEVANSQLGRYFSPAVAEKIAKADNKFLQPGGQIQEVTVLFTDIRNFTSISEKLAPDEVLQMLSAYHDQMVEILFQNQGTLDKFIGDAILATFGTPQSDPLSPQKAVQAAIAMNKALATLNRERKARGEFAIEHGIGIHTGPALVGNIGSKNRLEYTVIGDTVNIANRIESSCKILGHSILFSSQVQERIANTVATQIVGEVELKGKSQKIQLHTVQIKS